MIDFYYHVCRSWEAWETISIESVAAAQLSEASCPVFCHAAL